MDEISTAPRFYRAYHLTSAGRISRAEILEALNDGDALAKLRGRLEDHVVELWDRSRFIGKVEAARSSTTGAARGGADAELAGSHSSRMTADLFKPLFVEVPDADEIERAP